MTPDPSAQNTEVSLSGNPSGHVVADGFITGAMIGPYRLVELIGEGGMGQVWLADQTEPVRRRVALKLIKVGMDTREVVSRFESERQALALMDHPAIAKVFDAGSTAEGRPYFVMEYVDGAPITTYCDQHKLTTRKRMELFIQVCEGVQHAHQKAIIHRDLKPSNILVTEIDGKPMPRIIDFGVAKAMSQGLDAETMFTQVGAVIGTLGYMSPEQADSAGEDIDTRSDVYSLGVVLYELLVGALPLDLKKVAYYEMLRRLREQDAPRPSTRLRELGGESSITARNRGTEVPELSRQLRGDADSIALKALEKDRNQRYATPSELAADIGRYLRNEPVLVHSASLGYRAGKYVRRHRLGVSIAAAAWALLVVFAVMQAVELHRIRLERDRANRERDRATRVTDFITGMFKVSDPTQARGKTITAREILDKAASDLQNGLEKDPEVRAQLLQFIAGVNVNLGLYGRAHELTQQALDQRMKLLGPEDPRTLESMTELSWILNREGNYPKAEEVGREAVASDLKVLGPDANVTLMAMDHLAVTEQALGHYAEEEKLERQVIAAATKALGPEHIQTLISTNNMTVAVMHQGRLKEAEENDRRLLEVDRRVLGSDHPETMLVLGNLASTLVVEGRYAEAVPLYRDALANAERVSGPEHPDTALVLENLAQALGQQGQLEEAEKLERQALAIDQRALGPEHADTLLYQLNLADTLCDAGRLQEAEKLQRETLSSQIKELGPQNLQTLFSQTDLARTLNREGHYAEAEGLATRSLKAQLTVSGPQDNDVLDSLQQAGVALAHEGGYMEAVRLFRDVIAKQAASPSEGDPSAIWYRFATVAAAAHRRDDAFQDLREAVQAGFKDGDKLAADDDLKPLRTEPRFKELITQLRASMH